MELLRGTLPSLYHQHPVINDDAVLQSARL
jgi:hypothetical protein